MVSKADFSKQNISCALISLLQSVPIETITISSLVKHAGVSRNAFYNNYKTIEDVLKETYHNAHSEFYKDRFVDPNYIMSKQFIIDTITFFDQNTNLMIALHKWGLLEYVARKKTELTFSYITQSSNQEILRYPDYYMCFSTVRIFKFCTMWLLNGKKETTTELYFLYQYFQNIENTTK